MTGILILYHNGWQLVTGSQGNRGGQCQDIREGFLEKAISKTVVDWWLKCPRLKASEMRSEWLEAELQGVQRG